MSYARNAARLAQTGAPTVATAQALRDMPIYGGLYPQRVVTLGATTAGDGGGAAWRWDADSVMDDPVHLIPTGHTGAGRWVLLWSSMGPVDLRVVGMTTDPADATANTAALRALCALMSSQGGGEIYVPRLDKPWPVNGGVPPWYLDRMTIRGPGEIHHCDPGIAGTWFPAAIFYGGTYGGTEPDAFVYAEQAYYISDADIGAKSVTLSVPEEISNVAVGDLVIVHDGRYYLKTPGTERYHAPQVREVVDIIGAEVFFDKRLSMAITNDPMLRVLNTGVPPVSANMLAAGIDRAYLSRDLTIECDLSHAASGGAWGLFNPNLSYRGRYRGRFVSGNGIAANLQCQVDFDGKLTTNVKCWDGGYASEGTRVRVLHSYEDLNCSVPPVAILYANEGSHHCDIDIRTNGPVGGMTGTQVIAAPYAQHFKIHVDVDYPDWDTDAGAIFEAPREDNATSYGDPDMFSSDFVVSGRARVKRIENFVLFGNPSVAVPVYRGVTFKDFEFVADSITDPDEAFLTYYADEVHFLRCSAAHGNAFFSRPGGFSFRDCYMPNTIVEVNQAVSGYDRWLHNNTFADRVLDTELDRTGQINVQKDGVVRFDGGAQVFGSLYHYKAGTGALADGETAVIRDVSTLGAGTFWLFTCSAVSADAGGMALVMVSSADVVNLISINATNITWGTNGGTGVTITNTVGIPLNLNIGYNAIKL